MEEDRLAADGKAKMANGYYEIKFSLLCPDIFENP
jgi:hypothetical protein